MGATSGDTPRESGEVQAGGLANAQGGGAGGCFPKQVRLLRPAEFKRVFEKACKAGDGTMTLLARPNDLGFPRLGLAISKKNVRAAVARNRVKRLVRESFRLNQQSLGGIDIVFLARPGLDRLSPSDFRSALMRHWRSLTERCAKS